MISDFNYESQLRGHGGKSYSKLEVEWDQTIITTIHT